MLRRLVILGLVSLPGIWCPSAGHAGDPNWRDIKGSEVTLFYPGVASWEFVTSDDHRLGAKNITKGIRACPDCHINKQTRELDVQAEEIAAGRLKMKQSQKPFEPDPMPGKRGFLTVQVQAAYDDQYLYLRLQWASAGASWGNDQLGKEGFPDRVAIQLNKINDSFQRYGCFINCHSDAYMMPQSPSKTEVMKHPYYGSLKREDVKLYAFYTRKNGSGWANIKSESELNELRKAGGVTDLWKLEFMGKQVEAHDWSIFDDRREDSHQDLEGSGEWADGRYVGVFKRKLKTDDPDDVQLAEGDLFTIGIAIHDNKGFRRKHHVTYPTSLGIGAQGDITAVKLP